MSYNKKKSSFIQKKRSNKKIKEEKINAKFDVNKENKIGPWDESEDEILIEWVRTHGARNWAKCANQIQGRTGKQCREHWNNKLNENIKKGDWTAEDDLLILKFYQRFKSWKKIIPIFENRTENSIKNRFFSQLRKIAIKKGQYGKTDMVAKIGLEILKQYLNEAIEEAENQYFYENKGQTKAKFQKFMDAIENNLKYIRKGKFLDLNALRGQESNNANANVDNKNNNSINSIKNIFINNIESNNDDKNDINKDGNKNNINSKNNDSISFEEAEEEKEKKPKKKIEETIKKKNTSIKKGTIKESQTMLEKNISFLNRGGENYNSRSRYFDFPIDSNSYSRTGTSNFFIKVPTYNPFNFNEKISSRDFLKEKTSSRLKNNNSTIEVPSVQNRKTNSKISSRSSALKTKDGDNSQLLRNTSSYIESAKMGKNINPCFSFS